MRLIDRLKKIRRLEVKTLFRDEDDTVAFYDYENDVLMLFIDKALEDMINHWNMWGRIIKDDPIEFTWKFIHHVYLHELFHWAAVESSKQAEYMALLMTWNIGIAKNISEWLYQDVS